MILDVTYICARNSLNVNDYAAFTDFFIINPAICVGGFEACSVIIAQKEIMTRLS